MASVNHTQIRSTIAGPQYQVQDTINSAVGIETQLFLFRVSDDVFANVCNVDDVSAYPNTKNQAITDGKSYYRLATVTKAFPTLALGQEFADTIKARLKSLMVDYAAATTTFVGTTTESISS